jgi:hypothetical protein
MESVFTVNGFSVDIDVVNRGVPGRIENAFDRITECSSNLSKTSDILWLLLRSISRKNLDIPIRFPANQPQQIPF